MAVWRVVVWVERKVVSKADRMAVSMVDLMVE